MQLSRSRGFSLVELLVVISIIGITMALTLPSMRGFSVNAQIRSTGSALQSALRLAQSEAIRNSQTVVFYRTNETSCAGNEAAAAGGSRWVVRTLAQGNRAAAAAQCGSVTEGLTALTVSGPTAICFGPHGRPQAMASADNGVGVNCNVPSTGRIIFGLVPTATYSNVKNLQVWMTLGGSVRLCDKERAISASTPDGCPLTNQAVSS